jgi:hypothetical protein
MDGILLTRSEFLVLLDAIQAPSVIGLPHETLFPREPGQFRASVLEGVKQLEERGFLRLKGDIHVLSADLIAVATAMAYPQLAIITTRDTADGGQQLFLHYQTEGVVVEQTFPEEQAHRLAVLANRDALIERLQAILALPESDGAPATDTTLPQAVFADARAKAVGGEVKAAQKLLEQAGMVKLAAKALAESLQEPVAGDAVILLKCQKGQVTGSRNAALVHGKSVTWLITSAEPEAASFRVQSATAADVTGLLRQWANELAPAARRA